MKSISLHSVKNCNGWLVRIVWNYEKYRRFFNFKKCGGKEEALKKAILYRDRVEKNLKKPRSEKKVGSLNWTRSKTRTQNTYHIIDKDKEYILTSMVFNGVKHRKKFSVNKYGYQEAITKAVQYRKEVILGN